MSSRNQIHLHSRDLICDQYPPTSCCHNHFSSRLIIVKPLCGCLKVTTLLAILATCALIYSVVALILTCVFQPHPFFIALLGFSVATNLFILIALAARKRFLTIIALICTIILALGAVASAVYCTIYVLKEFGDKYDMVDKIYLISMLIAQVSMIFYVIWMAYLLSQVASYHGHMEKQKPFGRVIHIDKKY